MSRIGRMPIAIPAGITVSETADKVVKVKGPLGQLEQKIISKNIIVNVEADKVLVSRTNEDKETRSLHGMYRALINNMILGVSKGFSKKLIVNGVGYKCSVTGSKLVMNIGFSHPVEYIAPEGIKLTCPNATEILVEGFDKQAVGLCAAQIRALKVVEPYHSYGIRYSDEVVIKKEGKTAGK